MSPSPIARAFAAVAVVLVVALVVEVEVVVIVCPRILVRGGRFPRRKLRETDHGKPGLRCMRTGRSGVAVTVAVKKGRSGCRPGG